MHRAGCHPKNAVKHGIRKGFDRGRSGNMAGFARPARAGNFIIQLDLSGGAGSSSNAKRRPVFRPLNLRRRSNWEFRVFIEYSYG